MGRMRTTAIAKRRIGRFTCKPAPYQRTTEQNKGKQQGHFSGGLTIFKKTVAKLNVERGNRQAGGKTARIRSRELLRPQRRR